MKRPNSSSPLSSSRLLVPRERPAKDPRKRLEKDLEGDCREYAERRGCLLNKTISPGRPGFPDRQLFPPEGRWIRATFVEFKRPGEKPTEVQFAWHKTLIARGCKVFVIDRFDVFKSMIDKIVSC